MTCAPSEDPNQPDAQPDLSLRWVHRSVGWFRYALAHLSASEIRFRLVYDRDDGAPERHLFRLLAAEQIRRVFGDN